MAVAWNVPIKAIAAISIGIGDIALLYGAGRKVGSWLKTVATDEGLFAMLNLKKEDVIPRKATTLVDVVQLDRRWSNSIHIFHESQFLPVSQRDAKAILGRSGMDSFTWLMVLITAACFSACTPETATKILTQFLARRCQVVGEQAILSEMQTNIESWLSTARTRLIYQVASRWWSDFEHRGLHQAGSIPDNDWDEVLAFLEWLVVGSEDPVQNRIYRTSSSDTVALAMVMHHIGIDRLQALDSIEDALESQLAVIYDPTRLSYNDRGHRSKRRGVRVNMTSLEEVVSLWPGSPAENNDRRSFFTMGMRAADGVELWPAQRLMPHGTRPLEALHYYVAATPSRMATDIKQFCQELLLLPSTNADTELLALFAALNIDVGHRTQYVHAFINMNPQQLPEVVLEALQIFVLGYYYQLFHPQIDTRHMQTVEAFGSWTWNDLEFISVIRSASRIGSRESVDGRDMLCRHRAFALRVCAYLFAGAHMAQVKAVNDSCCGVHGKLTICDTTLLGDADTAAKLSKFMLLDVDRAAISSRNDGLIFPGTEKIKPFNLRTTTSLQSYRNISAPNIASDITSTIQPDWSVDRDSVLLEFRRLGRKIVTMNPHEIYHAILDATPGLVTLIGADGMMYRYATPLTSRWSRPQQHIVQPDLMMQLIPLQAFDGGIVQLYDNENNDRVLCLIKANALPKIRTCLVGLYGRGNEADWISSMPELPQHGLQGVLIPRHASCDVIIE